MRKLGPGAPIAWHWVRLSDEDPRFLPGTMHLVAPQVVCVHDRERTTVAGRDTPTLAVWLTAPPMILGRMSCRETPIALTAGPTWQLATTADPRIDEFVRRERTSWCARQRMTSAIHREQADRACPPRRDHERSSR